MRNQVGRDNVYYIHLTLLPYLSAAQELKTKPTQHSVKELRAIGIQPDAIICRSDHPVPPGICEKISSFCDVPSEAVIPLETVQNVYSVPLVLEEAGLGRHHTRCAGPERLFRSGLPGAAGLGDMAQDGRDDGPAQGAVAHRPRGQIRGISLTPTSPSARPCATLACATPATSICNGCTPRTLKSTDPDDLLRNACGIVVPGGFGTSRRRRHGGDCPLRSRAPRALTSASASACR